LCFFIDGIGNELPASLAGCSCFRVSDAPEGKDDFHTSIQVSKTGLVQRYREKAHKVLATAIKKVGWISYGYM